MSAITERAARRGAMLRKRVMPVLERIASEEGVTVDDILGPDRGRTISHARHRAIAVVRWSTKLSLHEIAAIFGRDHTCIMASCRVYEARLSEAS